MNITKETLTMHITNAKWADVEIIIDWIINHLQTIDVDELLSVIGSSKKQAIEIITYYFSFVDYIDAVELMINELCKAPNESNAIRYRNSLINYKININNMITKYLNAKSWQARQYLIQILAISKDITILNKIQEIRDLDKSQKVQETASQAIEYILETNSIDELYLIPKADDRALKIGKQDNLI